jgi:4-aminobutyrate aminotransferase-like enzyme
MRGAFAAAWDAAHPISGETPHSSTFYAHPIACAAALATLDVLEEESLVVRAQELGSTLAEGLAELARTHPDAVREVRGRGLLAGLVLATPALVHHVVRHALAEGVIVLPSGMEGDVISFSPPFTMDTRQLAWALAVLDGILAGVTRPSIR